VATVFDGREEWFHDTSGSRRRSAHR